MREVAANGVVLIAKESAATPAITLNLTFQAGTIFDPADKPGVAHFLSRILDRGTAHRTGDEIAEELDGRGASLSLAVNRHALIVVCTCLVEDLDAVLTLVADMVARPALCESEVATKQGEIITLVRQDEDNPAAVANEALLGLLYGDRHPYGRRPRGSVESVESIGRADLQQFHADRIRPGSLSLAMVGDVDPARAIAAASEAFGGWRAAAPAQVTLPAPPPQLSRRVRVIPMMNKAQTDIAYGFTSVLRSDPAYYGYWLMNNILGQYSLGGRLGDSIRERQGMAYYAMSSLDANVIAGPLLIRAGVSPANVERAVASIDEELLKMAVDGPTEAELTESKQYLIGSLPRTLETNAGIATYLQTEEFFGLGLDYDLRVPALLQAVTREQVHEAARQTLLPARAAIAVAGPYDGDLT